MYFNQGFKGIAEESIRKKYKVLYPLGQGGMSQVYLVQNLQNKKRYALKVSEGDSRRLEHEKKIMMSCNGHGIPQTIEYWRKNETEFLVMEYIKGKSLKKYVEEYGKIPKRKLIFWMIQICSILERLHDSTPPVIYMDLKPSNIMVQPGGRICLVDFGISLFQGEINSFLGTDGYASPEQKTESRKIDFKTDIYSLGKVCSFCRKSSQFQKFIVKCTDIKPENRYGSVKEIKRKLYKQLLKTYVCTAILLGITVLFFVFAKRKPMNKNHKNYLNDARQYLYKEEYELAFQVLHTKKNLNQKEETYKNMAAALAGYEEEIKLEQLWNNMKDCEIEAQTLNECYVFVKVYLTYGNQMEKYGSVWEQAETSIENMIKKCKSKELEEKWMEELKENLLEVEEHLAQKGKEKKFMEMTESYMKDDYDSKKAWRYFKRRIRFMENQGRNVSKEYQRFLKKYPEEGEAYIDYGIYLCKKGEWQEAKDIYMRGMKYVQSFEKNAERLKEKLNL